ncbi:MAG: response regulator, partial [Burkholderiaceae bacterium]|nr:response regulator [Burkholderiaceae bacterium]
QGYEPEILSSLEQFSASCAPGLEPPAAVIMDMVFPQGNIAGAEAVAEQLQSAHSVVPVIFVSVRDDMAARLAAQRVGATAYLVKPFDPAVLTLKLDQVTAREGAADYRVLVVDDDAEALELTLTLLTQAGMTAEGVSDPMQAFEAAMRLQPDCVVLDLHMPRCGGAELAAVLRADARFLDTPIVYLSDEWDFGRQLHALDMGGDLFLNKSESGGPLRLVGAVRMRARRAREVRRLGDSVKRSLREATRYRHAVDCHALVSVTDRHGTIVDVNDHFCEVSGYARSELLGQHHRILKSGVHPDAFYEDIWKTIGSGRVWHGEICDRNKAGGLFWMACSFVPFLDDTGAPYQYMATYTDISAHKDAQALLIAAKEQAEAANGAKTVFLRTMSHELRTPLNAVLGFSQLLDMKLESPESKSFVTGILHAGNHLLDLITEILDYASIESGRVNLTIEPVALQELCGESLGMIEQLASKRGIVIRHDAAQYAGVTVCADRVRLKQALLNYLSNAVKYNRNHGELRLDLSLGDAGRIRVAVADAGPGLSEQQIEMLFQPFVRLPQHVNRVEGTGIGLAITKRLVEAMGGSVGAQSEPGVGSCFWLELPAGPGVEARLPCP